MQLFSMVKEMFGSSRFYCKLYMYCIKHFEDNTVDLAICEEDSYEHLKDNNKAMDLSIESSNNHFD